MTFQTNDPKLKQVFALIEGSMPTYTQAESLTVFADWCDTASCQWKKEQDGLHLTCATVHDALMLIGRALTQPDKTTETLQPRFSELSAMLDVSRNSVYTLPTLKKFFCQLAFMGYTACYLYMEDTYELPGYPYFGYRRGRYSVAEQKELDDFAHAVGIELIPCIQTLAHLRTTIRWKYMQPMRDTVDNLMVGHEETLKLVDAMLAHFSTTFRSRRIHLGMDEAVSLGTGRYLRYKGYRDHREILMEHLHTVCGMCEKYGLEPLIWDDMLFRDKTPLMNYYGDGDPITEQEKQEYPANLTFVYWDYYHDTQEEYAAQIKRRGCLKTAFAGGVWKWGGWVPNFTKSFQDSLAAVQACCEQGIDSIMVTLWGDDGDETPLATVLPGLALFGLLRFGSAVPSQTDPLCRLLSGAPLAAYELMEKMDLIPDMPEKNLEALVPHKLLLYGDMASELFQPSITTDAARLSEHYKTISKQYGEYAASLQNPQLQRIMKMYQRLAEVLSIRCTASASLHTAWADKDSKQLRNVLSLLTEMEQHVDALHKNAVLVWSQECKGQGMEIIDLRLGGIQARCKALRQRIELYLAGELDTLSELDEAYLPYNGALAEDGHTPGRESYGEIVTANTLCHQFSI